MATLKKLPQIAPNANALVKTSQPGTSETSSSTAHSLAAAARSREFAAAFRLANRFVSPQAPHAMTSTESPRKALEQAKRIVVKIGSRAITQGERPEEGRFQSLADQIVEL